MHGFSIKEQHLVLKLSNVNNTNKYRLNEKYVNFVTIIFLGLNRIFYCNVSLIRQKVRMKIGRK